MCTIVHSFKQFFNLCFGTLQVACIFISQECIYRSPESIDWYIYPLLQFFKREEQNFVSHNEIDNMALIMPSQATRLSVPKMSESQESNTNKRPGGRRREKKRLEAHNSLNVACLKRLVPVGLGFFSGREQELLQQAKQKLLQVRTAHFWKNIKEKRF